MTLLAPVTPSRTLAALYAAHVRQVRPQFDRLGLAVGFEGICSCSWTGPMRESDSKANGDLREHWEAARKKE